MIKKYYVYEWLRKDGTPYYVGKGTGFRAYCKRPYKPLDKSRIKIVEDNLTEKQAFDLEIKLIAKYGRKDLGTGILRNKTDGGDGLSNVSEQTRKIMSIANKRKTNTVWNKGLTAKTDKRVLRTAMIRKNQKFSVQALFNMANRNKPSLEARKRMSEGQIGKVYPTKPCEVCGINMKINAMAIHLKAHQKENKSNYFLKITKERSLWTSR